MAPSSSFRQSRSRIRLKADFVDLVCRDVRGPVCDEETFVGPTPAVLAGAAIADGRHRIVAIGLAPD